MGTCPLQTVDQRLLARRVGADLAEHHGVKRYYSVEEIKTAVRSQNFPFAWDCWALALYASPREFAEYHAHTGESCDYERMHASMVRPVATDRGLTDPSPDGAGLVDAVDPCTPFGDSAWLSSPGLLDFFDLDV